ncbi:MAG: hypothetical protein WB424_15335 [Terracidiphilus sp.]
MTRNRFAQTLAIAVMAATALIPMLAQQPDAGSVQPAASTTLALNKLEVTMSLSSPDSAEFGMAVANYWKIIAEARDGRRAYDFFSALAAEEKTPSATLLAMRGSSACFYIGWLAQAGLMETVGQPRIKQIGEQARADFEEALKLDPQNFSALYSYAIYEGYRPGGQAHQKDLFARLDALRASRPYLPWQMVDTLEKTGKPE